MENFDSKRRRTKVGGDGGGKGKEDECVVQMFM